MSRRRQWIQQAAADAVVRFGPEQSALMELIRQAQADKRSGVRAARATARGITGAITQQTPVVQGYYDQAAATQAATAGRVHADLAGLQGVNPSILAAASAESAGAVDRLAGQRAATLTDYSTQKVAAQRGRQFAVQRARSDFASAVGKVLQRNADLAREQGAFITGEVGKSRQSARDQRLAMQKLSLQLGQQDRNSLRSSGIDPDTGLPTTNAQIKQQAVKVQQQKARQQAAKKGSRFDATNDTYKQATSQIGQAVSVLKTLDPERDSRNRPDVGQLLLQGHKGQPVYTVDATGKRIPKLTKAGTPVVTPTVPQIDQAYATAALDMYYNGALSRNTVRLLHKLGLKIKRLPVKTAKSPRPAYNVAVNRSPGSDAAQGGFAGGSGR